VAAPEDKWRDEMRAVLAQRRAQAEEKDYVGYALVGATIFVGLVLAVLLRLF
jgi:hypothetical protein